MIKKIILLGVFSAFLNAEGFFMESMEVERPSQAKKEAESPKSSSENIDMGEPVASKLNVDFYLKVFLDMSEEEFMALLPQSVAPKNVENTFYDERQRRVDTYADSMKVEQVQGKMHKLEEILGEAELILNENEKLDFLSKKILMDGKDRFEYSIYVGKLYLLLSIYYYEGLFEDQNLQKAKEYLQKTNRHKAAIPRVVSIFQSREMKNSLLSDRLDNGFPIGLVDKLFKEISEEYKATGLDTEAKRLEYVKFLKAFIQYVEGVGKTSDSRQYALLKAEAEKQDSLLKPQNRILSKD